MLGLISSEGGEVRGKGDLPSYHALKPRKTKMAGRRLSAPEGKTKNPEAEVQKRKGELTSGSTKAGGK